MTCVVFPKVTCVVFPKVTCVVFPKVTCVVTSVLKLSIFLLPNYLSFY